MRGLLLIAALWIAAPRAWALDSDIELGQIAHRSWTLIDRAPTEVTGLAQSADGLLWITSSAGLYWFDGFKFTYHLVSNSLPIYHLTALLAADGGLWVGFKNGGAARIVANELTLFGGREGLSSGPVHAIVQDAQGAIWLASHGGLFRFDGSRWRSVGSQLGLPEGAVTGAFAARDGMLWFASRDGVYSLSSDGQRLSQVIREQFTQDVARHFAQAPDGAIWLSDPARGLLRIEAGASTESHQWRLAGKALGALTFDREGNLWIGGDRLRRIVAARGDAVEELGFDRGLSGGSVTKVFQDRAGDLWIGTDGGIDRFRHANLVWAVTPPVRSPRAIVAGKFNRVWASYPDGTLLTFEGQKLVRREMAPPFTAALRDRDDEIWFGGPEAIAHLRSTRSIDEQRLDVLPLPAQMRGSAVQTMVRDSSGALWISIEAKGLFRFSQGRWIAAADVGLDGMLPAEPPLVSTLDESGNVWFGYTDNRLVRLSGKTIRLFTARDGLKVGSVTALHSRGTRLWVGGELGLALLDGAFVDLSARNCQTFRLFTGILETASNDLWVFRHGAVSRATQIDAQLKDRAAGGHVECVTFGSQDAPSPSPQQLRPTPSLVEAADGRVWLAANEGVAWLDPRRIREARSPPLRPGIQGVVVLAEEVGRPHLGDSLHVAQPHQSVVLEPNPGDLRIRYHAVELSAPEYLTFRYRLEGQDQRWKNTLSSEVVYTNLPPGEYRFAVMAGNRRTGEYSEPATMTFVIPPAFYQATWFRVLCALFGLVALVFIYRWQVRRAGVRLRARLEDRMKERERIARELHDTLLQGIQALVLRFQGVASRIPAHEPTRDMMERALELADDVIAEGRDRVNDLRDSGGTPVDLSQEIARIGKELLHDSDIRFTVTVDGEPRALHPIVREEGLLIAREALANAHRHAQPRAIEVNLTYQRSRLCMGIRDDGRGIDPEVLRAGGRDRHWGLRGMKERATRIRGHLEIWSRSGAGTEIELRVPAAVAYRDQRAKGSWLPFRKARPLDILSR